MSYYGSFVLQCYALRMLVMTSTVGGNLTNGPPALRHIHVNIQNGILQISHDTFRVRSTCTTRLVRYMNLKIK